MIRQVGAIVSKDLMLERRSKASLNALIFFAALVLVIVNFAVGPNEGRLRASAAAVLWIAITFAAILAFARAYEAEKENGCFEGLLLLGASPKVIYLGKLIATMAVMLVVEIVVVVAMGILDGVHVVDSGLELLLVGILGTLGMAAIGILYGRLTMSLRAREIMLPLLVFPVIIPALLASVKASGPLLLGGTGQIGTWVELLVVFDVVFVTAGLLTYEALARE